MVEKKKNSTLADEDRLVSITRIFNVPREMVFRAWTDPVALVKWFAPNGCAIHYANIEIRTGGAFHSCITTPDGYQCWCKGVYREISAPERIVFTMAIADEKGNLLDPVSRGMDPEWPKETTVTVTFADESGGTKLTLHQTVSETLAKRTGAHPSWLQMFDRLADELTK